MKRRLSFFIVLLACTCTKTGLHNTSAGVGTVGIPTGGTSTGTGTTPGSGNFIGASMHYSFPHIPTASGTKQAWVTNFADKQNLQPMQDTLSGSGRQIRVDGKDVVNGAGYCFSNESIPSAPNCVRSNDAVTTEVRNFQGTASTGRQTAFISAVQFGFRSKSQTTEDSGNPDYFFSEANFDGAYVEKAPIRWNNNTGALLPVNDSDLIKLAYGNGCNLTSDQNAVGFENPSSYNLGTEFYLSGLWEFERSSRKAFGEATDAIVPSQCDSTSGSWLCNLVASQANVWYSIFMPLVYSNGQVGSRQYPNQTIDNSSGMVLGAPSNASATFGVNSGQTTGMVMTPVIGKDVPASANSAQRNFINSYWDQYFITRLCIRGHRRERNDVHGIDDGPLVIGMRSELRSPYVKGIR